MSLFTRDEADEANLADTRHLLSSLLRERESRPPPGRDDEQAHRRQPRLPSGLSSQQVLQESNLNMRNVRSFMATLALDDDDDDNGLRRISPARHATYHDYDDNTPLGRNAEQASAPSPSIHPHLARPLSAPSAPSAPCAPSAQQFQAFPSAHRVELEAEVAVRVAVDDAPALEDALGEGNTM